MNYNIEDKEEYLEMVQAWKDHVNSSGDVDAYHHIVYNYIRSKDLKRGFTPVTRQSRLDAGHTPMGMFISCLTHIKYLPGFAISEQHFTFGLDHEKYRELLKCIPTAS